MKKLIGLLFLLSACSMDHKASGSVKVGPDLAEASRICDERYGAKTRKSEQCFESYLDYTTITVKIDLDGIVEFCSRYEEEQDKIDCEEDLLELLGELAEQT